MPQFLIVRGDDFVHLGIEWSGLRLEAASITPRLVASDAGGVITLTFPPQALAEPILMGSRVMRGRRSGTSRVALAVPAGTAMDLTTEGILGALLAPGVRLVLGKRRTRRIDIDRISLEARCDGAGRSRMTIATFRSVMHSSGLDAVAAPPVAKPVDRSAQ